MPQNMAKEHVAQGGKRDMQSKGNPSTKPHAENNIRVGKPNTNTIDSTTIYSLISDMVDQSTKPHAEDDIRIGKPNTSTVDSAGINPLVSDMANLSIRSHFQFLHLPAELRLEMYRTLYHTLSLRQIHSFYTSNHQLKAEIDHEFLFLITNHLQALNALEIGRPSTVLDVPSAFSNAPREGEAPLPANLFHTNHPLQPYIDFQLTHPDPWVPLIRIHAPLPDTFRNAQHLHVRLMIRSLGTFYTSDWPYYPLVISLIGTMRLLLRIPHLKTLSVHVEAGSDFDTAPFRHRWIPRLLFAAALHNVTYDCLSRGIWNHAAEQMTLERIELSGTALPAATIGPPPPPRDPENRRRSRYVLKSEGHEWRAEWYPLLRSFIWQRQKPEKMGRKLYSEVVKS